MTTWNDYSEGTSFAPSARHGWGPLDASAYPLAWFKSGNAPPIVRDKFYVTHRTQPFAATPSFPQTQLMQLPQFSSPARNTVEVLTFMTAPAQVTVTIGSSTTQCSVPAGVGTCLAPLVPGTVKATVKRGSTQVGQVTSPHTVVATPPVQTLDYVMVSGP